MRHAGSLWGLVLIVALVAVVGWPLVAVVLQALGEEGTVVPGGASRPLSLARESIKLVALTETLALPLGLTLAFLLFRADPWGRRAFRRAILIGLFIPTPLYALAWLGSFGNLGREQALGSGPILTGVFGGAFVHAVVALPWVVLLFGLGLQGVEPGLEETAWLDRPLWKVAWLVSFRRVLGTIAGAALAVAVLTAGDMTVTDLIPLRTYAEEAYTLAQLGLGQGTLAVRATGPQWVALVLVLLLAIRALARLDPVRVIASGRLARPWPLGAWRVPVGLALLVFLGGLLGLPIYGLVWRAGRVGPGLRTGQGASWSWEGLQGTLAAAWLDLSDPTEPLDRTLLFGTLLWAALGATLAVILGWSLAWKSLRPGPWQWVTAAVVALLLAVPGPIAGLALKLAYSGGGFRGMPPREFAMLARFLNRTPALLVMGYVVRTLPFALLVLWPALRTIPREYREAAMLEGIGPVGQAWRVGIPDTRWAIVAAWLLSFALAIGELPTSYFVRAPGRDPIAIYIWGLLHMGVESRLAGAGLILLGVVLVAGASAGLAFRKAFRGWIGS